jgi:hypothetical protein
MPWSSALGQFQIGSSFSPTTIQPHRQTPDCQRPRDLTANRRGWCRWQAPTRERAGNRAHCVWCRGGPRRRRDVLRAGSRRSADASSLLASRGPRPPRRRRHSTAAAAGAVARGSAPVAPAGLRALRAPLRLSPSASRVRLRSRGSRSGGCHPPPARESAGGNRVGSIRPQPDQASRHRFSCGLAE